MNGPLAITPPCVYTRSMGDTDGEDGTTTLAPGVRVRNEDLRVRYVRASGPGGQHVNKRATAAQLRVRAGEIDMDDRARDRLRRLARAHLTDDDEILITRDTTRSQKRNREACVEHLRELARRAIEKPKPRKKTKPSRRAVERRIDEKKRRGQIKRRRNDPGGDA